jgi:hypothetical protein
MLLSIGKDIPAAGVVLGNTMSHRIDEKMYMLGPASICIILLFRAAFGVT